MHFRKKGSLLVTLVLMAMATASFFAFDRVIANDTPKPFVSLDKSTIVTNPNNEMEGMFQITFTVSVTGSAVYLPIAGGGKEAFEIGTNAALLDWTITQTPENREGVWVVKPDKPAQFTIAGLISNEGLPAGFRHAFLKTVWWGTSPSNLKEFTLRGEGLEETTRTSGLYLTGPNPEELVCTHPFEVRVKTLEVELVQAPPPTPYGEEFVAIFKVTNLLPELQEVKYHLNTPSSLPGRVEISRDGGPWEPYVWGQKTPIRGHDLLRLTYEARVGPTESERLTFELEVIRWLGGRG